MKTIIILVSLLAAVSLAAAYSTEQQATVDGVTLSFQLGQAYEKASQGGDITAFNALVDKWNAWVVANFGNDAALLMEKMTAQINLQKPYAAANNTTGDGIPHVMDGISEYKANDVNLMSDRAISKYANSAQGKATGSEFLGGI